MAAPIIEKPLAAVRVYQHSGWVHDHLHRLPDHLSWTYFGDAEDGREPIKTSGRLSAAMAFGSVIVIGLAATVALVVRSEPERLPAWTPVQVADPQTWDPIEILNGIFAAGYRGEVVSDPAGSTIADLPGSTPVSTIGLQPNPLTINEFLNSQMASRRVGNGVYYPPGSTLADMPGFTFSST